ncbi:MAG: bifunctional DNA-formamidopyrimidine glycosylase/DNA-(apurinic or apyrimidinic site) lyase [Gemmatimonadaceae bacterium]|nr:bifunctional DNA-formamidopyrimidine glycosylase/DNA-(apurinic or apyrimidinic site) lyase [Gemmatimonadaceae bacterium]
MPELPETETIARDLHAMVVGARVVDVEVTRPDVVRDVEPSELPAALMSTAIARVWRRAKLIVLDLSAPDALADAPADRHLVVQPRFTGGLVVEAEPLPAEELAYRCVSLTLADGRRLHYRDVRRLGTVALMSPTRFAEYSGALGAEPLDPELTDAAFSGSLRSSRQAIKIALMDQKRLAGVGNIYANEALWRAEIDPSRAAQTLRTAEWAALRRELQAVLAESIAARGTSFRDYRDARGERGAFVEQLAAYGRAGLPCKRCGRTLVGTHAVDGRSTVFCPGCQF